MQIHFTKVVHFTQLIKAGGRLREFNFRKHKQSEEDVFSIDTVDDRGNRIVFYMTRANGSNWAITTPSLPIWITENEEKFREQIELALQHPQ